MKAIEYLTVIIAAFLLLLTTQLNAQENTELLTLKEQQTVVDSIGSKLNANYVFPKIAANMVSSIESKLGNGDYKSILDPQEFAATLTKDLRAISNDKHIRVNFAPDRITEQQQTVTAEDSIAFQNRYINSMKRNNFGFKEVKIMAGNISLALVTTALGLICALPLILIHSVVAGKAKSVLQKLDEQSAGLIAAIAEKESK